MSTNNIWDGESFINLSTKEGRELMEQLKKQQKEA